MPGPGLEAARLELQRFATTGIFVIQVCRPYAARGFLFHGCTNLTKQCPPS